jgi:ribonuclease VapC
MTAVLDASAIVAVLYREAGHDRVSEMISSAVVSTVNWAEVLQVLSHRRHPDPVRASEGLRSLGVNVEPFTRADAACVGRLWPKTRQAGLSLGDRACIAVAHRVPGGRAITADQAWIDLELGVPVELIR